MMTTRYPQLVLLMTVLLVWLGACTFARAQHTVLPAGDTTAIRIGTFDSRAVAVAYYRSEPFKQEINRMRADLKAAKAADDQERIKQLQAAGPAQQKLMHKQGFGTWPIDNILEHLSDQLPEIARQAKVTVIVSKWDIVYQQPGLELVDVTAALVKPFHPDTATWITIRDIQKKDPLPNEVLDQHED